MIVYLILILQNSFNGQFYLMMVRSTHLCFILLFILFMFKSLLAIVFDSLSLSSWFAHTSKTVFGILLGVVSLKSVYFKINLYLNLFDNINNFKNEVIEGSYDID